MIYHETDDTFIPFIYKTKSEEYIVQGSYHTLMREYRILEANNPTGEFRMFEPRKRDLEYGIDHYGDKFLYRYQPGCEELPPHGMSGR